MSLPQPAYPDHPPPGGDSADSALRAGIPTIVWDRRIEAARDLAELGAEVTDTAADAARRTPIVVTMVSDPDAVISVGRDHGMLAALAPAAICAQRSTIGVRGTDRVMAGAERPDVIVLDAPVSGRKDPAERGELTIFASGPGEAHARVAPLFSVLGQRTIWVGEAGAGTRLKLVNNTWLAQAGRRREHLPGGQLAIVHAFPADGHASSAGGRQK